MRLNTMLAPAITWAPGCQADAVEQWRRAALASASLQQAGDHAAGRMGTRTSDVAVKRPTPTRVAVQMLQVRIAICRTHQDTLEPDLCGVRAR